MSNDGAGSRVTAAGLAVMLLAVTAGVSSSGDPAAGLLLGLVMVVGVLVGASLVFLGVHHQMAAGPTTTTTPIIIAAATDAVTAFLRRNLGVVGLIMASFAVTVVVAGEAEQQGTCCAMLALLLLGLCCINIRVRGYY